MTQHSAPLYWCHDETPCCGTTPAWDRPALNWPKGEYPVSFTPSSQGEDHTIPPICLPLLFPCKVISTIFQHVSILHMSACHSTRPHSPLKIWDRSQAYCTTYKTHALTTCHGGTDCSWIEAWMSSQRTQNMLISTMKAPTAQVPQLP